MDTFPHSAADKDSPDGNDDDHFSDALDHITSLPPFSSSPSPNPVPEPEPYSIIAVAEEQDNNNQSSASAAAPAAKKHKPISAFTQPQPPPKKSKKKPNNVWTKSTSRKGKKNSNKSNGTPNASAAPEDTVLITPIPRFPDKFL